jgi:hypothetical protein
MSARQVIVAIESDSDGKKSRFAHKSFAVKKSDIAVFRGAMRMNSRQIIKTPHCECIP